MADAPRLTDKALLDRVAAGDQSAMRELYERHQGAVLAFAMTRLADRSAASDVLHEVMLAVWRKPEAFSGVSAFRSWLLTLTRNKSVDRMRQSSRLEFGDEGQSLVDEKPLSEDLVAAAQDRERLHRCIQNLSPQQQSALHLTFFEGLTIAEASSVEAVAPGTIKTRIFHAKRALAHCLLSGPDSD